MLSFKVSFSQHGYEEEPLLEWLLKEAAMDSFPLHELKWGFAEYKGYKVSKEVSTLLI